MPAEVQRTYVLAIAATWVTSSTSWTNVQTSNDGMHLASVAMRMVEANVIRSFMVSVHQGSGSLNLNGAMWNVLAQALKAHIYGLDDEPLLPGDADLDRVHRAIADLRQMVRGDTQ